MSEGGRKQRSGTCVAEAAGLHNEQRMGRARFPPRRRGEKTV